MCMGMQAELMVYELGALHSARDKQYRHRCLSKGRTSHNVAKGTATDEGYIGQQAIKNGRTCKFQQGIPSVRKV